MTTAGAPGLPDPEVLEGVAFRLVEAAPADWVRIRLTRWYLDVDVDESRMWVTRAGGARTRVVPPDVDLALDDLRVAQVAQGREPWMRCDVDVSREPGGLEPDLRVDFGYEVGDVPEQEGRGVRTTATAAPCRRGP